MCRRGGTGLAVELERATLAENSDSEVGRNADKLVRPDQRYMRYTLIVCRSSKSPVTPKNFAG